MAAHPAGEHTCAASPPATAARQQPNCGLTCGSHRPQDGRKFCHLQFRLQVCAAGGGSSSFLHQALSCVANRHGGARGSSSSRTDGQQRELAHTGQKEGSPVCAATVMMRTTVSTWPLHNGSMGWGFLQPRAGTRQQHVRSEQAGSHKQHHLQFGEPQLVRGMPAAASRALFTLMRAANPNSYPALQNYPASPRHHNIEPRLAHQKLLPSSADIKARPPHNSSSRGQQPHRATTTSTRVLSTKNSLASLPNSVPM